MGKKKVGLLIMAYGTPYEQSDIKRYYTHIRNGREPSQEALDDLTEKYEAIGGVSPMAKITKQQVEAISAQLNELQDDIQFEPFIGLKHIEPFIEDAVDSIREAGIEHIVSLVLAPHYSSLSIKGYNKRAKEAADKYDITISSVESWYTEEGFIEYWAKSIKAEYAKMTEDEQKNAITLFSAHSLPTNILKINDPYVDQLKETAKLIAKKANITNYEVAWQSEGNTRVEWLGPDVCDVTKKLYNEDGYRTFVYAPVGFVSDHLEVLYDNDIECKEVCDELNANYYRPEMPNTDALFIETLAKVVLNELKVKI